MRTALWFAKYDLFRKHKKGRKRTPAAVAVGGGGFQGENAPRPPRDRETPSLSSKELAALAPMVT